MKARFQTRAYLFSLSLLWALLPAIVYAARPESCGPGYAVIAHAPDVNGLLEVQGNAVGDALDSFFGLFKKRKITPSSAPSTPASFFSGSNYSENYQAFAAGGQLLNQSDARLGRRNLLVPNGGLCASTCFVNVIGSVAINGTDAAQFNAGAPQIIELVLAAYSNAHREELKNAGIAGQLIIALDKNGRLSDGRFGASAMVLAKNLKPLFEAFGGTVQVSVPATEGKLAEAFQHRNSIMIAASRLFDNGGAVGGPHGAGHAIVVLDLDPALRVIRISDPNNPNHVYNAAYHLDQNGKINFTSPLSYSKNGPTRFVLDDVQIIQKPKAASSENELNTKPDLAPPEVSPAPKVTPAKEDQHAPLEIPASIKNRIDYLRRSPNSRDEQRVASFDTLVKKLEHVRDPLDFKAATDRSELNRNDLQTMRVASAGFASAKDSLDDSSLKGGYALGFSEYGSFYPMYSERMGLVDWPTAYRKLGIDWQADANHTEHFMNAITKEGQPPIVFFVPDKVFTHPKSNVTAKELRWLLDHPEKLKNVTFLFGAYDSEEMEFLRKEAGISQDEFRALFMRALGAKEPSVWEKNM